MISIVTVTNKSGIDIYKNIFKNYLQQSYQDKELILIINRSSIDKDDSFYRHVTRYNNDGIDIYVNVLKDLVKQMKLNPLIENTIHIYKYPIHTLGDCLNKSVNIAKGSYWCKFDDDDFYGKEYIHKNLYYIRKSGADIVGKRCVYILDKQTNKMYITNNSRHKRTDFVRGPTFFCKKDLFKYVKFPLKNKGEDTEFLKKCVQLGKYIYTTDEYDFIYIRDKTLNQTSDLTLKQYLGCKSTQVIR